MKKLNIIASIYLLICGVVNILSFFALFFKSDLSSIDALLILSILGFLLILTIVNNVIILRRLNEISKQHILVNLLICFIQVFRVSIDNFQYKLNEGLEIIVYATKKAGEMDFHFGAYIGNFDLSLAITFIENTSTGIEINILMLMLVVFYFIQWQMYPPNTANKSGL